MSIHRTITISYSVAFVCAIIGCDSVTLPGGASSDGKTYLAVSISDFGGASALTVRDDVVTLKSAGLLLLEDLLENAPDDVSLVVRAPDVVVTPDDGKGITSSTSFLGERHAAVTFRLAPQGSDACASDVVIGPFGLTTASGAVSIAGESLLASEAAKALVLSGRFEICAQILANFDGLLSISKFSLQFGRLKSTEDGVELCHIPPGNPDNRHTITVGLAAVDAHLAHGDYLGPCSDPVADLVLTSTCSNDPGVQRRWRIGNPNAFDVEVTWEVLGTDQSSTVTAPPGDSFFFTETIEGANTTTIRWLDEEGVELSETKASGGAQCNTDADGDGVTDDTDACPGTPMGEEPDAAGCSCSQRDGDADGVNDCNDNCPATSGTEASDANGCACSERDSDLDGVSDCDDECPFTPTTEQPNESGCSCSQRDGDADGVNDCNDACPDTTDPTEVGTNGCPDVVLDADDDGVMDEGDACPETPVGEPVDDRGCSCTQSDEDNDGVNDCDDLCPNTPEGTLVDINGCGVITADAGSDVILDEIGCFTLQGSASGGTEPYTYSWSAPGWEGSMEQTPVVVPFEATTYTLTVTDWSSPPQVSVDTMTVAFSSKDDLQYTIVNLGSPEGNSSYATGLNDVGAVVGYYYTASWEKRAFVYREGTMVDLGTLGGTGAFAEDINNLGMVVGQSRTTDQYWHAFLWDSSSGMQDLGTFGGTTSIAYAINESGQVAGHADTAASTHAFIYSDGIMADLGTQDYLYSAVFDINDSAQTAGTYLVSGGTQSAFVYGDGTIVDLGSPLLDASRAVAINNSELVAGYSWGAGEYRSFLYACDTVIDLGAIESFPKTYAWDINNAGQVVGNSSDDIGQPTHATIFTGGTLYDLNDLLVLGHGWEYLAVAFAINNTGQIVGYGRIDGQFRAFLATPAQ